MSVCLFLNFNRNASTKLPFHIDRRGMNSEFIRFDSAPTSMKASSYSSFIVVGLFLHCIVRKLTPAFRRDLIYDSRKP